MVCFGSLRRVGPRAVGVVVSGKLRGQRAKSIKFVDGLMIHSGDPVNYYVDTAVHHVLLRQGVLSIKVKIMLPWDPSGKIGPKKPLCLIISKAWVRLQSASTRIHLGPFLSVAHNGKTAVQIAKKKKFVACGIFKAELNDFLTRELAEDGYSGVEVQVTPTRTEIIILATRTQNVLGEKGRHIRELTAVVQKRFGFPEGSVELYAEKVATRGLCAIAQAKSLRYKLLGGLAVRKACYGVLRFITESGAKGCGVVVSGKLRGQRAKSMTFVNGLMIHSGDPVNYYVDTAVHHVLLRQGVLGIKVKIMLPWDPSGSTGWEQLSTVVGEGEALPGSWGQLAPSVVERTSPPCGGDVLRTAQPGADDPVGTWHPPCLAVAVAVTVPPPRQAALSTSPVATEPPPVIAAHQPVSPCTQHIVCLIRGTSRPCCSPLEMVTLGTESQGTHLTSRDDSRLPGIRTLCLAAVPGSSLKLYPLKVGVKQDIAFTQLWG
ncbi:hypothetical protein NN561_001589 [Cricetulus griseus]